jgi:hypothetical protein
MYEVEKQKLQYLLGRKQKADSLAWDQKIKWESELLKIEKEIVELMQKLGQDSLDEYNGINLLLKAQNHINGQSKIKRPFPQEFWDQHSVMRDAENYTERKVQNAFKLKSMWLLKNAINEYITVWLQIGEISRDPNAHMHQIGFREIDEFPDKVF